MKPSRRTLVSASVGILSAAIGYTTAALGSTAPRLPSNLVARVEGGSLYVRSKGDVGHLVLVETASGSEPTLAFLEDEAKIPLEGARRAVVYELKPAVFVAPDASRPQDPTLRFVLPCGCGGTPGPPNPPGGGPKGIIVPRTRH